jgi:hypothetical protein
MGVNVRNISPDLNSLRHEGMTGKKPGMTREKTRMTL